MNAVIHAAAELQTFCVARAWRFCLIGGIAVLRWGEARETVDVDATLLTGFGGESPFIDALVRQFEPRIENAAQFALTRRVLLLRSASGVGLDIALGGLPFEASVIDRSSLFTFPPRVPLRTCSAEDLVVLKAFAAREKDWLDVEGIIIRQHETLDWSYVQAQLAILAELKEEPEILAELDRRKRKIVP